MEKKASASDWQALERLYDTIMSRKNADPESSYVAKLHAQGRTKIAQKLGEEAVETALAAALDERGSIVSESADLLFHLLVLWADAGVAPQDVLDELNRREGLSGLEEKRRRGL